MKFIKQFGIILAISFIGEIMNYLIPLPVPASIYGLVLMLLCLHFGIVHIDSVKRFRQISHRNHATHVHSCGRRSDRILENHRFQNRNLPYYNGIIYHLCYDCRRSHDTGIYPLFKKQRQSGKEATHEFF